MRANTKASVRTLPRASDNSCASWSGISFREAVSDIRLRKVICGGGVTQVTFLKGKRLAGWHPVFISQAGKVSKAPLVLFTGADWSKRGSIALNQLMLRRFVLQNLENCSEHPYIDFCWRGSPGLSCRGRIHAGMRRGLPPSPERAWRGGFRFNNPAGGIVNTRTCFYNTEYLQKKRFTCRRSTSCSHLRIPFFSLSLLFFSYLVLLHD